MSERITLSTRLHALAATVMQNRRAADEQRQAVSDEIARRLDDMEANRLRDASQIAQRLDDIEECLAALKAITATPPVAQPAPPASPDADRIVAYLAERGAAVKPRMIAADLSLDFDAVMTALADPRFRRERDGYALAIRLAETDEVHPDEDAA